MARYIEFQGKVITTGEWVVGNLSFTNTACPHQDLLYHDTVFIEIRLNNGMIVKYEVIPETVGQYTNVIGCDRKRIYDHDIVSDGITEGEVYWDYCYNGWKIAVVNNKNDLYGIDFDDTFKVVGHKYDHLIHSYKEVKGECFK